MKHTAVFSRQQRTVRSKLAKIVHDKGLVRGTIITMKRTCGNPNCRCARGEKHVSLYLSRSEGATPFYTLCRDGQDRDIRRIH